jgi:hypothetical protein
MSIPSVRAAIYLRVSLDSTGEQLAVRRQCEDCRKIATDRRWTVVGEDVDNSVSASGKKARKDYDAMVEAYKADEFDALICWDLDRLTRNPRQLEDWIEAAQDRKLLLVTANGEADLSTDAGRLFARIKASVARAEIERKGARQRRCSAPGLSSIGMIYYTCLRETRPIKDVSDLSGALAAMPATLRIHAVHVSDSEVTCGYIPKAGDIADPDRDRFDVLPGEVPCEACAEATQGNKHLPDAAAR